MMRDFHIEESLNEQQKEAVLHTDGPLLILAGAGSGKTGVIVHRIANLVCREDVPPWNILAITFTNKAADELRKRARAFVGSPAEKLNLGTFHALCSRMLRENSWKREFLKNFVIYDESDRLSLIKKCLKELKLKPELYPPGAIKVRISRLKDRLVSPEDFPLTESSSPYDERVAAVYRLYQKHLRETKALDFDDLLMVTVQLLKSDPDILARYQDRFRYLMVDEYQDTNYAQFVLLKLLSARHENICVVGDDDQSIYRWRGANLENILNFEKHYPRARVIKLEENYRSTKTILSAASSVVSINLARKHKSLWTGRHKGDPITYHMAQDEEAEAEYIRAMVEKLNAEGLCYRDIAVFYRTNAQSRVIEEALFADGIPYQIVGDILFYQRREIRDLIAYLKFLSNPDDSVSLRRIINIPPRCIGEKSVKSLEDFCGGTALPLYRGIIEALGKGIIGKGPESGLQEFLSMVSGLPKEAPSSGPAELLEKIVRDTGYFGYLDKEDPEEALERKGNVRELILAARQFEETQSQPTLQGFLDRVSLISEQDSYDQSRGAVTLMTLHSSKGLEFPVVFMAGMEDGLCPHSRSAQDIESLEEERRLCYVGMTRAQEKLFLTSAFERNLNGLVRRNSPSPFIHDIPQELMRITWDDNRFAPPDFINFDSSGRRTLTAAPGQEQGAFPKGATVVHPKFGVGIVSKREEDGDNLKLTINFKNHGQKKLVARYAHLKEI